MKFLLLTLSLTLCSLAYGAKDKLLEKKDFSIICAVSAAAKALSKDEYVTDKAERALLVSQMIEQNVKTDEVKNVMKAFAVSAPSERTKLMKQAAEDVGLKNWNCSTLKFLF